MYDFTYIWNLKQTFIETENRIRGCHGLGEWAMGRSWLKGRKFHLYKISSGHLPYSTVPMANNAVLYTQSAHGVDLM